MYFFSLEQSNSVLCLFKPIYRTKSFYSTCVNKCGLHLFMNNKFGTGLSSVDLCGYVHKVPVHVLLTDQLK